MTIRDASPIASPAIMEEEFWKTIDDAWAAVEGGEQYLTLLSTHCSLRNAARLFIERNIDKMRANLEEKLEKYADEELRAWHQHFENTRRLLCEDITSCDDGGKDRAAFAIACGRGYVELVLMIVEEFDEEMNNVSLNVAKKRWGPNDVELLWNYLAKPHSSDARQ